MGLFVRTGIRLAVLTSLVAGGLIESPAIASVGSIAFTSNRNGSAHVWVMSADGTDQRQVSSGAMDDIEPNWSVDGNIAFSRGTGYNQSNFVSSAIWVMVSDGTGAHALPAPANTVNYRPSWSPDGRHIAFVRVGQNGADASNPEIWVMDRNGANQHLISAGSFPTWSPDGTRLAYGCGFDICTAATDGTSQAQVTHTGDAIAPNWYPGTRIIYVRSIGTGITLPGGQSTKARQIFVMNPDGSGQTRITNDSNNDIFPTWSPDGDTIAFSQGTITVGALCCGYQIATIHTDGTGEGTLTDANPAEPLLGESFPTYAPRHSASAAHQPLSVRQTLTD